MNWTDWSFPFLQPVFSRRQTGATIQIKTRQEKLSFSGTLNKHNWGAVWSYRALVKAILNRISRSFPQARSRGPCGSRDAGQVVFFVCFHDFPMGLLTKQKHATLLR